MADGPVVGFLAAMIWGFGPTGYGPNRTSKMIIKVGTPDELTKRLEHMAAASKRSPVKARHAIVGDAHIPGLGPAFGTKFTYFSGLHAGTPDLPLISDFFTSRALWHLTDIEKSVRTESGYEKYIDVANEWAD